jgi:hypothetical protein
VIALEVVFAAAAWIVGRALWLECRWRREVRQIRRRRAARKGMVA